MVLCALFSKVYELYQTGFTFVVNLILAKQQVKDKKVHQLHLALDCLRQILDHLRLMPLKN